MKKHILTSLLMLTITPLSTSVLAKVENVESYIIKFNDEYKGKTHIPKGLLRNISSVKFKKTFKSALSGVAVELTKKQVEKLLKSSFIDKIEKDTINKADISWAQDRVDQRDLPLDGLFSITNGGNGANIYVLDTGININHNEFSGRIGTVTSTISGGATNDCNGHGTHVASIAAGENYGVAPSSTINSIRIAYNCEGDSKMSDMIEAFEWVIDHGQPNSIINLSYTANSYLIRYAMDSAVTDGHVVVSAAGNNNLDSCTDPGSQYKTWSSILVGASTSSDGQSSFSNFGSCVDLYAPGSDITAAYHLNNTGTTTMSGTSMASPIVAGLAAGYRSTYPNATPQEVFQAIINSASSGKLSGLGTGSPNKLAYNILTVPSFYWQDTGVVINNPIPNATTPFGTCSLGNVTYKTLGFNPGNGLYYQRVWECK